MKFNNLYESVKDELIKNAPKIQSEFNVNISDGWNLLLKRDKIDNNILEFVLMADDKKYNGNITIIEDDYEISWESETPLENEGIVQGEDLETTLKRMVDGINFNEE